MKQKISQVTQKQINRAFQPSFARAARTTANIFIFSTTSWLFYHALLPSQACAQDNKAKAPSGQVVSQEQLQPNEKRIPLEPVDIIADSAAIRQLNERMAQRAQSTGSPVPKLKIEGKAKTFPVDMSSIKSLATDSKTVSITIYKLGPSSVNINEANSIQRDGVFKVCGASCFYTVNGEIFVATRQ